MNQCDGQVDTDGLILKGVQPTWLLQTGLHFDLFEYDQYMNTNASVDMI